MRRGRAALVVALSAAGCAAPREQIVEDRFDVSESSSAPAVTDVADLGGGDVPLQGLLHTETSDGFAVVGETLWIHGNAFGRQPAVTVGGRPAAVLARTRDGGILVRVPPLTAPGARDVVVSNEAGRGARAINVRRLAGVLDADAGEVAWTEVGANGPIAAGTLRATGTHFLALSADGRAAYLVDGSRSLVEIVDVAANGGPKVVGELDLGPDPVVAVAAAARAWTLAVVRARDVALVDLSSALRPARGPTRPLPVEVREAGVAAADLSPDGKRLAVASETGNRVVLLDLGVPAAAVVASLDVLPDVREGVLADVTFSPTGDTLWIVAGDTPRSRASGPQPTQVIAARVEAGEGGAPTLRLARTVTVADGAAPERIAAGRTIPLASGSAIRLPPERASVFVSGRSRASATSGAVFRVGAADAAPTMLAEPGRFGQADLTPDGRWLLAPLVASDGSLRLYATPNDARPGTPKSIPLLAAPRAGAEARRLPALRVQP